ncbi:hypothetical protein [Acinetobacter baumannii]|uniref:hypothetical protein n=1 Tax=Acinetobacter baumannii TaxID=470 RepID=UPI000D123AE2|nr:hypothetical protein [Acinetobacter baumannii]HDU8195765.1 hypothetical protein [Acinetobacter baumannii]HDU8199151.1 hypothetical protein [Acinetobacter baumannii]
MDNNQTLAEMALELARQNKELIKQTNKLIEQNTLIVQINAEQSAQLNELLAIFEEGEPVQKAKSLDG